jgi:uncharacterized protein DUF397
MEEGSSRECSMNSHDRVKIVDALPASSWKSATFCGPNGGNCVEVNLGIRKFAGVRDSKSPTSPALVLAGETWSAFLAITKSGRIERS